ncbi:MAG: type I-B CRISPR-associated protein Cas8b/Csh1 [Cyanobacteriota bacterium]
MLSAVKAIGENLSKDKEPIDSLIKVPPIKLRDDKTYYTLKIIFNLLTNKVEINQEGLSEYDPINDYKRLLYIGVKGGNCKNYYSSVDFKNTSRLFEKIIPDFAAIKDKESPILLVANKCFEVFFTKNDKKFKLESIENIENINQNAIKDPEGKPKWKELIVKLSQIGKTDEIVLLYPSIKLILDDKEAEYIFANTSEFKTLLIKTFIDKNRQKKNNENQQICYICKQSEKPNALPSIERATINHSFVTTTKNHSWNFEDKYFNRCYQVCKKCNDDLNFAGKYINERLNFRIANVQTLLIPQFIGNIDFDYEQAINKILKTTDIAFRNDTLKTFISEIESEKEYVGYNLPFTLNFLSYSTEQKKAFKIFNFIKDVSKLYFINLIEVLEEEHSKLINEVKFFNLSSIYYLIPIDTDKSGANKDIRNKILSFYSNIFTGKKISKRLIYKYFTDLITCYRLDRQNTNIYKQKSFKKWLFEKNNFDFAIKDSIYNYLILINTLNRLNLFFEEDKMETTLLDKNIELDEKEKFLLNQGFNEQQKALYYLGDMINQVGYCQFKAGHDHKPILNKITYQGMTVKDIKRLYLEVFEKLVQYNKRNSVLFFSEKSNQMFKEYFDRNEKNWKLSDEENVFYLLSGYAYNIKSKTNLASQDSNSEGENKDDKQ